MSGLGINLNPFRFGFENFVDRLPGRGVDDVERAAGHACVIGIISNMPGFAEMGRALIPGRRIGTSGLFQTFLEYAHDLVIFRVDTDQAGRPDFGGLLHAKVDCAVIKAEPSSFLPTGPGGVSRGSLHHVEIVFERGHTEFLSDSWNVESLLVRGNKACEENVNARMGFNLLDELWH